MNSPKGYPLARATDVALESDAGRSTFASKGVITQTAHATVGKSNGVFAGIIDIAAARTSNYNQASAGFCLQIAD